MQFFGLKIFYKSIGKKIISFTGKWKGEIMSTNSIYSIYGFTDYASVFEKKTTEQSIRNDQMLRDAKMTIPINQSSKKDEQKGLVVEREKKLQKLDFEIGNLAIKSERKALEDRLTQVIIQYGLTNGQKNLTEKEARKIAKLLVKNERYRQESERTTVYMDKEQYEAAKEERNEKYDELYSQFREQGLTRRAAKERANAELGLNEYVKNKHVRAFIEGHEEEFYDENGNFQSDKLKDKAVDWANTHTKDGEVENYYLSLKERREIAAKLGIDDDIVANIADKSNIGLEKDYTEVYQALAIAGGTALGAVLGHLFFSPTATAVAGATAGSTKVTGVTVAEAGAEAVAKASVSGTIPGALAGGGLGALGASFIKDKGGVETPLYAPAKPEEEQPNQDVVQDELDEPDACELTPGQTYKEEIQLIPTEEPVEYCSYDVKKDDLWYGIVQAKYRHEDGSPLSWKEVKEVYTALKEMHDIPKDLTYIPLKQLRLYSEINGKKYCVDCEAKVKEKNKDNYKTPTKIWTGKDPGVATKQENIEVQKFTPQFYFIDCSGKQSEMYDSKEARDIAMAAAQRQINEEFEN